MFAAQYGHRPIVELLVSHEADVLQKAQVSHTLSSGVHNLYTLPFIHNINHVATQGSLIVLHHAAYGDPLSVSSTCCPSSKTESLRWMRMVRHAFTGLL